jgi:hypothetical protein
MRLIHRPSPQDKRRRRRNNDPILPTVPVACPASAIPFSGWACMGWLGSARRRRCQRRRPVIGSTLMRRRGLGSRSASPRPYPVCQGGKAADVWRTLRARAARGQPSAYACSRSQAISSIACAAVTAQGEQAERRLSGRRIGLAPSRARQPHLAWQRMRATSRFAPAVLAGAWRGSSTPPVCIGAPARALWARSSSCRNGRPASCAFASCDRPREVIRDHV